MVSKCHTQVVSSRRIKLAFTLPWSIRVQTNPNMCEPINLIPSLSLPPNGFTLLNVDVTLFAQTHCMGVGFVLRNNQGNVLMDGCRHFDRAPDPKLIEVTALRYALSSVIQVPCNDGGFRLWEYDCQIK